MPRVMFVLGFIGIWVQVIPYGFDTVSLTFLYGDVEPCFQCHEHFHGIEGVCAEVILDVHFIRAFVNGYAEGVGDDFSAYFFDFLSGHGDLCLVIDDREPEGKEKCQHLFEAVFRVRFLLGYGSGDVIILL